MAHIWIQDRQQQITDRQAIEQYLGRYGIWYEYWPVDGRIDDDADAQDILDAYEPEIDRLMHKGKFVAADVINVTPQTPNLDALLEKFNKEHTHSEDEVRFVVKGRGIFHINPGNGDPVFAVQTDAGDMINVPRGTKHWFDLCDDRCIRCIRLFEDQSGWTPQYVEDGAHDGYVPLCFSGHDVKPQLTITNRFSF